MSKKKREAIVALHAEGCTTKDIEKWLKVLIRTVQNVLKRYRETGSTDTEVAVRALHALRRSLKALKKAWNEIPMEDIRAAIDAVLTRLDACIVAQGGRFEK
uniref:Transposase n=1 Tax=Acrobeloides nanus TaxID=290746 RepID=A0A914EAB3_9BILA